MVEVGEVGHAAVGADPRLDPDELLRVAMACRWEMATANGGDRRTSGSS